MNRFLAEERRRCTTITTRRQFAIIEEDNASLLFRSQGKRVDDFVFYFSFILNFEMHEHDFYVRSSLCYVAMYRRKAVRGGGME